MIRIMDVRTSPVMFDDLDNHHKNNPYWHAFIQTCGQFGLYDEDRILVLWFQCQLQLLVPDADEGCDRDWLRVFRYNYSLNCEGIQ